MQSDKRIANSFTVASPDEKSGQACQLCLSYTSDRDELGRFIGSLNAGGNVHDCVKHHRIEAKGE